MGTLGGLLHIHYIYFNTAVNFVSLSFYLLIHGKNAFGPPKIDEDSLIADPMNDAGNDLALAVHIVLVNNTSFRFADALHHDLFCCLRSNPSEVLWRNLIFNNITQFIFRVDGSRLFKSHLYERIRDYINHVFPHKDINIAPFTIYADPYILSCAIVFLICRNQSGFDGFNKQIFRYVPLFLQIIHGENQFFVHAELFPP